MLRDSECPSVSEILRLVLGRGPKGMGCPLSHCGVLDVGGLTSARMFGTWASRRTHGRETTPTSTVLLSRARDGRPTPSLPLTHGTSDQS